MQSKPVNRIFLFSIYFLAFLYAWYFHWIIFGAVFFLFSSILFVFANKTETKQVICKENRVLLYLLTVYFLLHITGLVYSEDFSNGLKKIGIKIYFVLLPWAVFLTIDFVKKYIKEIIEIHVLSSFFSSVLLLVYALIRSLHMIDGHLVFNAAVNPKYTFWRSIVNYGNYFFYGQFSQMNHPAYYSVVILMAVVFLLYYDKVNLKQGRSFVGIFLSNKKIRFALIFFFSFIIFLVSSRANYLAYIAVLIIYFYTLPIRRGTKLLAIPLFTVFLVFLFLNNPRFNSFYQVVKTGLDNHQVHKQTRVKRFFLWEESFRIIKKYPLLGCGTGDVEKMISQDKDRKYNVHNEFLEAFVRLGIIGGLLFLSIFVYLFLFAIKRKNWIFLSFVMMLIINYFFESMWDRISGTIFFGFFILILMNLEQKQQFDDTENLIILHKKNER